MDRKITIGIFITSLLITYVASIGGFPGQLTICGNEADVVFTLDRSGSVGANIVFLRAFAIFLAEQLELKDDGSGFRAGIVSYAQTSIRDHELSEYGPQNFLNSANAVDEIPGFALTNIEEALNVTYQMITDTTQGAREGVKKIVIFTNKGDQTWPHPILHPWDPNNNAIKQLHDNNITVISVEIREGPQTQDRHAKDVASSPENHIVVNGYENINNTNVFDQILDSICTVFKGPIEVKIDFEVSKCAEMNSVVHTMTSDELKTAVATAQVEMLTLLSPFAVSEQGVITLVGDLDDDEYVIEVFVTDSADDTFGQRIEITITVDSSETCSDNVCEQCDDVGYFWKEQYCPNEDWSIALIESKITELLNLKSKWTMCNGEIRSEIDVCAGRTKPLNDLLQAYCHCDVLIKEVCKMIENLIDAKSRLI